MRLTRQRPGTRRGPAENVPSTFMTRLVVMETAADGTTTECHAHVADHPA
ncbi:hypothetical protein ACH4L5_22405 [Streptomyces sp. NPDC017405]